MGEPFFQFQNHVKKPRISAGFSVKFNRAIISIRSRRKIVTATSLRKGGRSTGMFERYTEQAKRAIENARSEAALRGAKEVAPAHLLLGLSREDNSRANHVASLKDRMSDLCAGLGIPLRPSTAIQAGTPSKVPLSQVTHTALAHAEKEANREWSEHIDTDHLLRGLMRFSNEASEVLKSKGVNLADVRAAAKRHRIEVPSVGDSIRWVVWRVWKMAWPVVWRLALLVAVLLAIKYAILRLL
jgi:uncharacterized protein YbjQ (UPF0145 family)